MAYQVELERIAAKAFSKLPAGEKARIANRIDDLATDPRPAGAVKLTGADGWRIRAGNYRIVYQVDDTVRVVTITRIGHRRDVYRRHD